MEGSTKTILVVLVIGVVAWLLFQKASQTFATVNKSVKDTYTTGTAVAASAVALAPALGKWLGSLGGSTGGADGTRQSGTFLTSGTMTGDSLLVPSFADGAVGGDNWGGSSYSYDSMED